MRDMTSLSEGFLFTSPWKSIVTQGYYHKFDEPVGSASLGDDFQKKLYHHFKLAKKKGIMNPILAGAIPFDPRRPAILFIPKYYQVVNRDKLLSELSYKSERLPKVLSYIEIPKKEDFTSMVSKALNAIQSGEVKKVVLSRKVNIITQKNIDTAVLMRHIMAQSPDSYHFHLPLPQGGFLVGASPELILRKRGNRFDSCPLAGTMEHSERDLRVDHKLMRSVKNLHEHQLVITAMQSVLREKSISLSIPSKPSLISTTNLWHLATKISGEVKDCQENALSLACSLHPTPALSGFPHQQARDLISQLEPFDRYLFGGIVGWSDDQGNGEWAVTIRCSMIEKNHAKLFAGSGIVASSDPEDEWQETRAKLKVMLKIFGID